MSRIELLQPSQPDVTTQVQIGLSEVHQKLISRKQDLDRALGLCAEIPSCSEKKIETCRHEFAHAIVGEIEGINIKWISANANENGKPPYLGVTHFEGRATAAMVVAGAVAAGDCGTGGDKHYLNVITGGRANIEWDIAKAEAKAKLGDIDDNIWNLASRIFIASGGEGDTRKMHLAFERARIEMQLRNVSFDEGIKSINIDTALDSRAKKDHKPSEFETVITERLDGAVEVIEHNLITGKIEDKTYFPCCGGEKVHKPSCEVGKIYSEGIKENQNKSLANEIIYVHGARKYGKLEIPHPE